MDGELRMKKTLLLCLLFSFMCMHASGEIFSTLNQLQEYANNMDEYPSNDNVAWATPVYRTFWRKQAPSRWENFLYSMRIRRRPLWYVQAFRDLMLQVTKMHESNGYINRFVVKMQPAAGSLFVIWGDVQGAFHSLVRVLDDLQQKGFINDRLQIIKPYTYFVFNGNLINRGAYSLEVLTVIMRLMERNPQRIFYLKGSQEDSGHWKNFNLKDELIIRAGSISKAEIPLGQELDRFFNTLPLALYLIDQESEKSVDVVRISNYNRKWAELNEDNFSTFFQGPHTSELSIYKLGGKSDDFKKKINVRAIVEGESRTSVYRPSKGLAQLEADKGATAWTMLSSPIESFRHLQDFYFDAFAILDIGKQLSDWIITLYNQDVRELLGIQKSAIFNLVTGLREYQKEKIDQNTDKFAALHKQLVAMDEEIGKLKEACPAAQVVPEDPESKRKGQ